MVTIIQGDYARIHEKLNRCLGKAYFDFNLTYTGEGETFREINRFIWESKRLMTRFKNRYNGPVSVCLSEWNDGAPNGFFDTFIYFIKDYFSEENVCFYVEDKINSILFDKLREFYPELQLMDLQLKRKNQRRQIGFAAEDKKERNDKDVRVKVQKIHAA